MKKSIFKKIGGLFLGLAMGLGVAVGVAAGSKEAVPIEASSTGTYALVTSTTGIAAGDTVIIVNHAGNQALKSISTTGTKYGTLGSVSVSNSKITLSSASVAELVVRTGSASGSFAFEGTSTNDAGGGTAIANGKYLTWTSGNSLNIATSISANSSFTLNSYSASNGMTIANCSTTTRLLRYNNGSGQERFACYTSATGTLVDIYKKEVAQKYTVTYDPNNATSGTVPTDSTQYTNGSTVTVKGNTGTLARTGYTFGGWNTKEDGTGTNYTAGSGTFSISANTTLYAKWNLNSYTVNGSGIINGSLSSTANVNHGDPLDIYLNPSSGYAHPDSITVTMDGSTLVEDTDYTYDDSTETHPGEITILEVTGNIVITATCPSSGAVEYGIDYDLSHCSIASAPSTMWSDDAIELTIVPADHYKLPAEGANKVSVTGAVDWRYDDDDGTITIDGAEDDLTVSVECIAKETFDVSLSLTNVAKTSGPSGTDSVEEGEEVTFVFAASANYGLPATITVVMGGDTLDSNDYVWTQSTGTLYLLELTDDLSVTIIGVARTITSISLSTNKGSYALGDTFTMPIVNANYNVGASEEVTAFATATGGGLVDGVLTETGSKTITISYGGFNASYTATVTAITPTTEKFVKVTSGTVASGKYLIVNETAKVAFNGGINSTTYDTTSNIVSVTISSNEIAYSAAMDAASFTFDASAGTLKSAAGYYIGRTASSTGINASKTEAYTNTITVSSGTATIKASNNYVLRYNANSGQDRFRYYSGESVQAIQIYKYQAGTVKELKWITAALNAGTYYQGNSVTASDFVVTGHYNDGSASTLSTGVTVTNGYLADIGNNEVTLTYSGKSCKVNVNAVEQSAEYTGLSWAQGEYTIIDGQNIDFSKFGTVTAEYNDGEVYATKAISSCTVAIYTKSGDVYTKVADLDDGDAITSSSHGKYLGVTYTDTNTYTAYSSAPIYVVEAINDVYKQVATYSWSKVTSLSAGDIVTFVSEAYTKVASEMGNNIINATSYEGSVSTDFYFTVGTVTVENKTYYTFQNENGYLGNHSTGTSGNNNAYLDAQIDTETKKNYFTVSFDEGNAVITSVYDGDRVLQMRSGTTNDRFCFYGSSQDVIQLYKGTAGYSPTGESFANINANVQKAVLQFAEHFNDTMNCVNSGTTADVASKWSTLSSDFSTAMSGFTGDDLAHFKALFANAYSVEGGDTLQDMLARYNYIVAKYKLSGDFLHEVAGRGAVAYSARVNPIVALDNVDTSVWVISAVIVAGLTAIGGYFFYRKRKEN